MSSSSDDDYCCKNFDALQLLYNKVDAKGPKPGEYCVFDNLASLEGYIKRNGENLEEKFDKTKRPVIIPKNKAIPKGEVMERRFLPHQQMIPMGHKIKARHQRSVLTDMENFTGPLGRLQFYVTERIRVKVLIRKNHGVRGSVTGILRLFDHHWNLVLTDVQEQYRRRKFRHANGLCGGSATEREALQRLKELGLDHPMKDAIIKPHQKKWVDIQRKHDLLFVKGDQVVVVIKGDCD